MSVIDTRLLEKADELRVCALIEFYRLMANGSTDFPTLEAITANRADAGKTSGWLLEIASTVAPRVNPVGFLRLCDTRSPCPGCERVCIQENAAYLASLETGMSAALSIVPLPLPAISSVVVTSFVAGSPELSDRWLPIICPRRGRFALVTHGLSRIGFPRGNGELDVSPDVGGRSSAIDGAIAFNRLWRESLAAQAASRGAGQ